MRLQLAAIGIAVLLAGCGGAVEPPAVPEQPLAASTALPVAPASSVAPADPSAGSAAAAESATATAGLVLAPGEVAFGAPTPASFPGKPLAVVAFHPL